MKIILILVMIPITVSCLSSDPSRERRVYGKCTKTDMSQIVERCDAKTDNQLAYTQCVTADRDFICLGILE